MQLQFRNESLLVGHLLFRNVLSPSFFECKVLMLIILHLHASSCAYMLFVCMCMMYVRALFFFFFFLNFYSFLIMTSNFILAKCQNIARWPICCKMIEEKIYRLFIDRMEQPIDDHDSLMI